jgi:hypothetical protein
MTNIFLVRAVNLISARGADRSLRRLKALVI